VAGAKTQQMLYGRLAIRLQIKADKNVSKKDCDTDLAVQLLKDEIV